jgi:hypothetical protein
VGESKIKTTQESDLMEKPEKRILKEYRQT